ncbi:hypothetical protein EJ357_27110 [Streptomyces cyaneochromogenes]|uniref:Uncharacterized protein n=1 Tax=Streptomyces cyaneochromogenes TaxID=2496836 RepID=A0A3S9MBV0_9ACTN|nr:hypothetical protein [Streptomyces cyaneochromogenes]AZQ36656.1 hypothetical protein EJ357_27110 [Streptomyces cyaneochromogenes]
MTAKQRELPLRETAGVLGLLAVIVGPYVSVGALAATIATEASTAGWAGLFFIGAAVPFAVLLWGGFTGSRLEQVLAALALVLLLLVFAKVLAAYAADGANKVANEIANPGSLASGGVEGAAALITAVSGFITSVAGCLTAWAAFRQSRDNRQPPPDGRPADPPSDG